MTPLLEQKWDIEAEVTFGEPKKSPVVIKYITKRGTTTPPNLAIRRAIQKDAIDWVMPQIKDHRLRFAQFMGTINYFLDNYPEIEFLILHRHLPEEQRCKLNQL